MISKYRFREIYLQYFFFLIIRKENQVHRKQNDEFSSLNRNLETRRSEYTVAEGNMKFLKHG